MLSTAMFPQICGRPSRLGLIAPGITGAHPSLKVSTAASVAGILKAHIPAVQQKALCWWELVAWGFHVTCSMGLCSCSRIPNCVPWNSKSLFYWQSASVSWVPNSGIICLSNVLKTWKRGNLIPFTPKQWACPISADPTCDISTPGKSHCCSTWSWGLPAGSGDYFGPVCLSTVCWPYPISPPLTFQTAPGFASFLPGSRYASGSRDLPRMWFQVQETITATKTGWSRMLWDQPLSHGFSQSMGGRRMSIFLTKTYFLGGRKKWNKEKIKVHRIIQVRRDHWK